MLGGAGAALLAQDLVVVPGSAHIHAGAGAAQPRRGLPGVLQGTPDCLEHEPLLGVDVGGLPRGDPEERRVERVDFVEEATHRLHGLFRVELGGGVPALGRDRTDRVAPLRQKLPETVDVVGSGQTSGHADNGDELRGIVVHFVRMHGRLVRRGESSRGEEEVGAPAAGRCPG